jgi:hypothetical protein
MLAQAAGVGLRSVQRILAANQLAPHRIRTFGDHFVLLMTPKRACATRECLEASQQYASAFAPQ